MTSLYWYLCLFLSLLLSFGIGFQFVDILRKKCKTEKNIKTKTFAASLIWYPSSRFNLVFESIAKYLNDIHANGSHQQRWQVTSNPGLRFATDLRKALLVAGASFPFTFDGGSRDHAGIFLYLSLEAR